MTIAGQALLPGGFQEATLSIADGQVLGVSPGADPSSDFRADGWIVPGFIDLQINGAYGFDFTLVSATAAAVGERLPRTGVTAFLPTIISAPLEAYPRVLRELEHIAPKAGGAQILGAHLEGPYLNPRRVGAHNRNYLRAPDLQEYGQLFSSPVIRIVTLAPELPGAFEIIRDLRARGIVVSAGHSDATATQAAAAFKAGVNWGTHLFNAMSPFLHRAPGLVGAFLASDIPSGLIVDGIHADPTAISIAFRAKGARAITLVTDAMAAMGLDPGSYGLGSQSVIADASSVRLADGTLAGSILQMDQAVRNVIRYTGCSLADAVTMASTTPARVLNLDRKGRLAPGCDADVVVLDEALHVQLTIVRGQIVYEK